MDAFAVAMGTGTYKSMQTPDSTFRISFHFGLFQFLMPIAGWLIGKSVESLVTSIDHWIAFGLLTFIGLKMVYEYFQKEKVTQNNPSKGLSLISLSIATSIDAFAVGLSLAFLQINILLPCIVFGIITGAFAYTGIKLGGRLGKHFGKSMELAGGLILVLIGFKILLTDTLGILKF
jgi:putative Mn2+ efflux pump MntP